MKYIVGLLSVIFLAFVIFICSRIRFCQFWYPEIWNFLHEAQVDYIFPDFVVIDVAEQTNESDSLTISLLYFLTKLDNEEDLLEFDYIRLRSDSWGSGTSFEIPWVYFDKGIGIPRPTTRLKNSLGDCYKYISVQDSCHAKIIEYIAGSKIAKVITIKTDFSDHKIQ